MNRGIGLLAQEAGDRPSSPDTFPGWAAQSRPQPLHASPHRAVCISDTSHECVRHMQPLCVRDSFNPGDNSASYLLFLPLFIECTGVTRAYTVIQVSAPLFHSTPSAHCTVRSPPQVKSPPITVSPCLPVPRPGRRNSSTSTLPPEPTLNFYRSC